MTHDDELGSIPPIVPDRDDVDSHHTNKRSQGQEIVRPTHQAQKVRVSTWPVRIMLFLLTAAIGAGGYGAYYFWEQYQYDLRQADLRVADLEMRMALMGESSEETDSSLMEGINRTIEQYDLLWANWRSNNAKFTDIESELAKLGLANEGQDELINQNTQVLSTANQTLTETQVRVNSVTNELNILSESVAAMDQEMAGLAAMRGDLDAVRDALNSGDSTVLGLVGRLEYMEQSMESVNAHRLQINETLFRLQENIEALQRSVANPGG